MDISKLPLTDLPQSDYAKLIENFVSHIKFAKL